MAKEILLYSDLYGWTAERAINDLNDARNQSEVVIRFNGDGGELRYGWAIIGKAKELKGKKLFKNDGEANSMMAFAFAYNDNNEALDTSSFKLHRASYGTNYEASEYFSQADQTELADKNAKLKAAMESKINVAKFKEITGYSLDELFAMPGRVECSLNAEQALAVGLINRIVPITPEYKAQITALSQHFSPSKIAATADQQTLPTMLTPEQIKAQYPDAYKAIFAKGKAKGIESEKDRIGSILAYIDADKKGVLEAIKSDKPLSETQRSEFAIKAASLTAVATLAAENPPAIATPAEESIPAPGSPAATTKADADKKVKAELEAKLKEQFKQMFPNSKKAA